MTFKVTTTEETHRFMIATDYKLVHNETTPSFLKVYGDDDFEDGEIELQVFNLNHVVNYGWER